MFNIIPHFRAIKEDDKSIAVQKIVSQATPDFDFFFMMILSVLMATFGLLSNNETIVIGSMLLAPLMNSILSFSLGLSMSNNKVITRSSKTILKSIIVAVLSAGVITLLSLPWFANNTINITILSRTTPSLLYFAVAFLSGIAITYTTIKPHLSSALAGIAVSVALIPPLSVIGIGIASFNFVVALGAFGMVVVNIAGIIFASTISFSLMDIHHKKYLADIVLIKEKNRVEKEKKEIEELGENND